MIEWILLYECRTVDAVAHDVLFYLEGGELRLKAPKFIICDPEAMQLIHSHKSAIHDKLVSGFDCVRDGITVAELKTLTAAARQGKVVSMVRVSA